MSVGLQGIGGETWNYGPTFGRDRTRTKSVVISKLRLPGERPFAVIKRVFGAGG